MQENMNVDLDQLVEQLDQIPMQVYSYVALAALFGPFVLRLLGLKALGQLLRPVALVILVGGIFAKRQKVGNTMQGSLNV